MLQILPFTVRRIAKGLIPALLLMFFVNDVVAQPCTLGRIPNPIGNRRPVAIPNTSGFYNGLIEYLPNDYASSPASKRYPIIIYFTGFEGQNDGSVTGLCDIVTDQQSDAMEIRSHLVDQIENGVWGTDVVPTVGTTSFIVIAPQYSGYGNGGDFTWADQTDALIDWILEEYPKADPSRVYLTGMSTGSNLAMDYISSSVEHAQRIAAASFGALCFPRNLSSSPNGAQNIATGDVATWFVHCDDEENSNVPPTNAYCVMESVQDWVAAINTHSPTTAPRFTTLTSLTPHPGSPPYPSSLNWCRGDRHDAWSALYNPDFAPSSGAGPDFYEWALQFEQESALPVVLKSFTARLSNGKVYLRWVTTSEQDNASFAIERAGSNGTFATLTSVSGGGSSSIERVYEYVDESPLTNLSFYRLKQQDVDGRNKLFETRKVMNKGRFKSMIIVTPNPFTADVSAFINVDKKQKVSVLLTDMSGRVLSSVSRIYEEGTTELSLPSGTLPRGVYFIKVAGENITETHKIIKQ